MNHIHLAVLQRSKKKTVVGHLNYITCGALSIAVSGPDYQAYRQYSHGYQVLLPVGAPPEYADIDVFAAAITARERRVDAQEGRTIDFAIPRVVPPDRYLFVASFVMAGFVRLGMATCVAVESPPATDGRPNPHGHAVLAQRSLAHDGFGGKVKDWNALFLRDNGRYARALIASRLTLACALLGLPAHVDPRSNKDRGLSEPEIRISRSAWRKRERGEPVEAIDDLVRQRAGREKRVVVDAQAAGVGVTVSGAVPPKSGDMLAFTHVIEAAAVEQGSTVWRVAGASSDVLHVATADGVDIALDGRHFHASRTTPVAAQTIINFAKLLGWPALVVEGPLSAVDELMLAGAFSDLAVVNRTASPSALAKLQMAAASDAIKPVEWKDDINAGETASARLAVKLEGQGEMDMLDFLECPDGGLEKRFTKPNDLMDDYTKRMDRKAAQLTTELKMPTSPPTLRERLYLGPKYRPHRWGQSTAATVIENEKDSFLAAVDSRSGPHT